MLLTLCYRIAYNIPMNKRELSRHMSELGRAGAIARTKALTVKQRKDIATYAANCRWNKDEQSIIKRIAKINLD